MSIFNTASAQTQTIGAPIAPNYPAPVVEAIVDSPSDLWVLTTTAFGDLWTGFISYTPRIISAILIFIIGWFIASALCSGIYYLFRKLRVDNGLRLAGVEQPLHKAGVHLNTGKFFGEIVRWFVVIGFFVISLKVLNITSVADTLQQVLGYVPGLVVAILVLLVATLIGELVKSIVVVSGKAIGWGNIATVLGKIAKWVIIIIAILLIIPEAANLTLVTPIITAIVFGLALAFGLAFGLGGQEAAKNFINKLVNDLDNKQ